MGNFREKTGECLFDVFFLLGHFSGRKIREVLTVFLPGYYLFFGGKRCLFCVSFFFAVLQELSGVREQRHVFGKQLPKMMQNHMKLIVNNEFKSYTVDGRNPAPPRIYKTF